MIAILLAIYPVQAQGVNLSCVVAEEDAGGEWVASRSLTVNNGVATSSTSDTYQWQPKESILFDPGMSLKLVISYHWPAQATAQKTVPEDDVAVIISFWFDAKQIDRPLKNPQRSWIHLYRSSRPEHVFSPTSTSLTNMMLWNQFSNGNLSSKAVIPLDDLLAFGKGFDALVWNIRGQPNEFGGTQVIAKGVIPIAVMRDKVSKIPKLRRMLDKKMANFQDECRAPIMMSG